MKFGTGQKTIYVIAISLLSLGSIFGENSQHYELCSNFIVSSEKIVLFCGNTDTHPEDYSGTSPRIYVFPAKAGGYGFISFGWDWEKNGKYYNTLQNGVNEKGLAFARNGLPKFPLIPHPERPFSSSSEIFWQKVMRECSSVACVIEMANNFDWASSGDMEQQLLFADSTGDAVVISAGKDGELAFTRKDEGKGFLVSTNFNRANPENGGYPCWRYDTAVAMLERIEREDDLTVGYSETILNAIHVGGTSINTVYSYIFDLNTGDIYVYYFHQFEEGFKLNLSEELVNNQSDQMICSSQDLTDLFSQETKDRAKSEFYEYQKRSLVTKVLIAIPLFAGFIGFCLFIHKKRNHHRRNQARFREEKNPPMQG